MNTNFGMSSNASAHVERGGYSVGTGLPHIGELFVQRVAPSGEILQEFTARNLLTNQGATYMLNRAFFPTVAGSANNYAAHEDQAEGTGLYMGLYTASHTAAATNVPTSFNNSGVGANYKYYATSPLPEYPNAAVTVGNIATSTTRELVNSATLDFVITNGGDAINSGASTGVNVGGVFIISNSTNNETAATSYNDGTDLLVSVAPFTGGVPVNVDDTLKVTYRHTFS